LPDREHYISGLSLVAAGLVKRLILEEIGRRFLTDEPWRRAVHEQALKAWNDFESTVPAELNAAQKQLAAVEQRIARMVDQIEDDLDDPDVKSRLLRNLIGDVVVRDVLRPGRKRPPSPG